MIDELQIQKLIDEKLADSSLFLTELVVKQGNNILVFIDGDHGVSVDDCIALSRHIESNLDRDSEDFSLQVSSAGVDQPLKYNRQYVKNIGRKLDVELADGAKLSGTLLAADNEKIQIQTETKKGRKIISGDLVEVTYSQIARAVCLVSFK